MRVGLGYDIHRLVEGRKLILGGVEIPHTHGLDGHSDADALTHAVCDALLGAIGEGDLGEHFPSHDPRYKNMDSLRMLKHVVTLLNDRGHRLMNVDTTIMAEAPRLRTHLASMKKRLAEVLSLDPALVSVKVKSGDQIGVIGRKEGIGAQAVCLVDTAGSIPSSSSRNDG